MVPRTSDMRATPRRAWPRRRGGRGRSRIEARRRRRRGGSAARCRRSSASISHGTMLAWCSISVSTHRRRPPRRFARPQDVGDQVERLGRVLGEDDLVGRVGGADEPPGRPGAPARTRRGGLLGDGVDAAVHVGVRRLVVARHGVDDDLRLQRGGRPSRDRRCGRPLHRAVSGGGSPCAAPRRSAAPVRRRRRRASSPSLVALGLDARGQLGPAARRRCARRPGCARRRAPAPRAGAGSG